MRGECGRGKEVVDAAATGRWSEATREHAAGCEDCGAAAAVAAWMDAAAKSDVREHKLPDPAVLWLRAKLLRQYAAVHSVSTPLNVLQMSAYVLVAAGWAALLTWKWHMLQGWLAGLTPTGIMLDASGAGGGALSLSLPIVLAIIVLASMTVMLALHTIIAEE